MCGQGDLLTLRMRNMWAVQDLASSLNCPANIVLEFLSIENESPIVLPWGGSLASCLMTSVKCETEIISVKVGWVMMHNRNSKFQQL